MSVSFDVFVFGWVGRGADPGDSFRFLGLGLWVVGLAFGLLGLFLALDVVALVGEEVFGAGVACSAGVVTVLAKDIRGATKDASCLF